MTKALILCAGAGSRLKPLTDCRPKPMVEVAGRPVLEHTIDLLKRHGIRDIAVNLHHYPEVVTDYFGDGRGHGISIHYAFEKKPLGTAGAVKNLNGFLDGTFAVIYGDVLSRTDLTAMLAFHEAHDGIATVGLYRVTNPRECGLVEMNPDGRITRFLEKPGPDEIFTDLANAGVYILDPETIGYIPENTYYDFGKDLFPALLRKDIPLYGYPIHEYLIDMGTLEKHAQADNDFRKGRAN